VPTVIHRVVHRRRRARADLALRLCRAGRARGPAGVSRLVAGRARQVVQVRPLTPEISATGVRPLSLRFGGAHLPLPRSWLWSLVLNRFAITSFRPRRVIPTVAALGFGLQSLMAHAALDAAITTAVGEAKDNGLAVAALLTGMAVAVWAAIYLKRKFFG
jgi:hypothetical protein